MSENSNELIIAKVKDKLEPGEKIMLIGENLRAPDVQLVFYALLCPLLAVIAFVVSFLNGFWGTVLFCVLGLIVLKMIHRIGDLSNFRYYALTSERLIGFDGSDSQTVVERKEVGRIRTHDDTVMLHFNRQRVKLRFFKGIET